jgi:branched-chain amino acid transport system ATP-binding protein
MMLEVSHVDTFYGAVRVLRQVSLAAAAGEVVALMGRNGAGKTTLLRTVMGLLRSRSGTIRIAGEDVTRLPAHVIPRRGVAYVPQGRRLFNDMTVAENLRMGLYVRNGGGAALEAVLGLLPVLRDRLGQRAGTLSGGEQQILAMARALCSEPRLILLDEPSEGLAPEIVDRLLDTLLELKRQGVAVVLVEQRVNAALRVADRVLLMETGEIRHAARAAELAADPVPLERYIGVHR